jgi:hypothetical protein
MNSVRPPAWPRNLVEAESNAANGAPAANAADHVP